MGLIQDIMERERKVSEAFKALANDPETHEAIMKATEYMNELKNKNYEQIESEIRKSL